MARAKSRAERAARCGDASRNFIEAFPKSCAECELRAGGFRWDLRGTGIGVSSGGILYQKC